MANLLADSDKKIPTCLEAEQAVLGCMLLAPLDCVPECMAKLKAGYRAFHDLRNQEIYKAITEIYDKGEHIDLITVPQFIKESGKMLDAGGRGYISGLPDMVASPAMLNTYLEKVLEKHVERVAIRGAGRIITEIAESKTDSPSDVIALFQNAAERLLDETGAFNDSITVSAMDSAKRLMNKCQERFMAQGAHEGVMLGLRELDRVLKGLDPGTITTIAAAQSVGKTSFMLNVIDNACINGGIPAGIVTLETPESQLAMRMMCMDQSISYSDIKDGIMDESTLSRMAQFTQKLASSKIMFADFSSESADENQVAEAIMRIHKAIGARLIGIDYIGEIQCSDKRISRSEQIGHIIGKIRAAARKTGVAVILLSQINREGEKSESGPQVFNIADSVEIQRRSDNLILLDRRHTKDDLNGEKAYATIAKQRDGERKSVELRFDGKFYKWSDPRITMPSGF